MSSTRYITDQQFSDGTTIDGDRLEKAMQDLEDFINNVSDGNFKSRWTQTQVVMKHLAWAQTADTQFDSEQTDTGGIKLPWMPVYNPWGVSGIPTTNRARFKGNKLSYQAPIYANNPGYGDAQVAWTTTLAIGASPVVIDAVDVVLAAYMSVYQNSFLYDTSAPPAGKAPGSKIDNIHVTLTMDSPFLPNIQTTNSVLWHKYGFNASSAQVLADAISTPSFSSDIGPNVLPTMGTGLTTTLRIREENLRIPVPPYAQLRFSLILPDSGEGPWFGKPWQTMIPTMSLTLLERLESD